jgi:predicted phosphohydrolase
MKVFAISDLHLSAAAEDKSMDVFGPDWEGYMQRISQNWTRTVDDKDLVLIPGDISWATYLNEAGPDFRYIEELPGRKLLVKGNHDYWWSTKRKLDQFTEKEGLKSISFVQNNAFFYRDIAVVGSRAWKIPEENGFTVEDEKIYNRELIRLELSLKHTKGFGGTIIAMLHYPPYGANGKPSAFVDLLLDYRVSICVYGHLHGKSCENSVTGDYNGIRYYLVSADYLNFTPICIGEW